MPVGLTYGRSARPRKLRRRSSTGSMSIRRAAMSRRTSRATDSNDQGPRYAVRPGVLENTEVVPQVATRDPVRTGEEHAHRDGRADRPRGRVGADVLHVVDARAEDLAVVREGHAHDGVLVAGLAGRHQVLAAILDPLERGRDLRGREHQADVLPEGHDLLAERAAGVAHDHADPVLVDAEHPGGHGPDLVGRLGGGPDRQLSAGPLHDQPTGLDGHRGVGLLVDLLDDDVGGAAERLVELLAVPTSQPPGDVALVALVDELGGVLRRPRSRPPAPAARSRPRRGRRRPRRGSGRRPRPARRDRPRSGPRPPRAAGGACPGRPCRSSSTRARGARG